MKNLKLKLKLVVGFLIVALLTVIVGVVGFVSITDLAGQTALLNDRANIGMYTNEALANINEQRVAARGAAFYVAVFEDDLAKAEAAKWGDLDKEYDTLLSEIDELINNDPETQQKLDAITAAYKPYRQGRDVFEKAVFDDFSGEESGVMEQALQDAFDEFSPYIKAIHDPLLTLADNMEKATDVQAEEAAAKANMVTILMVAVLAVAVIAAIALGLYLANSIARPMGYIKALLDQVADSGKLETDPVLRKNIIDYSVYKDELGASMVSLRHMIERLREIGHYLDAVAAKDLTIEIKTLSAEDTMGVSISTMVSNLNDMFAEINSSASQVSTGSQQIANGAQSLAQGSTEQAAASEQLSSSISEVAQSINEAAAMAKNAAELAVSIQSKAEHGTEQMSAMMEAVREINDASQNISKVIKVIDDIAFQTNILALNAAVEAARAGSAGKGFAVVAEEVRSLAAKSADAAKDTGTLIESSIQKAELGVRIASETNDSLSQIVEGIIESSKISQDIATSSDQQSVAIEQINTGIDQVAQVVQQNSATAEESAAASEELSGQSALLNDMIAQFKLKGGSALSSGRPTPRISESSSDSGYTSNSGFGKY